ncbi:hypothetical protein [Actinoplanes xinjiangensis]
MTGVIDAHVHLWDRATEPPRLIGDLSAGERTAVLPGTAAACPRLGT